MTSAITRQNIRRELYNQVPGLGVSSTATDISGNTLTDAIIFADSTLGNNHYRGYYLYRPDRSTTDRVQKITQSNAVTGIATTGGSAYSNTSDYSYEIVGLLHPDEINACITRAQSRIYVEYLTPMRGLLTDGDMETSGVTNWAASLSTRQKITTAASLLKGTQGLEVTNTSTNGYVYQTFTGKVAARGIFYVHAACLSTTATAQPWVQVTNDAGRVVKVIADADGEHGANTWYHFWIKAQLADYTRTLQLELGTVLNGAITVWSYADVYPADMFNYNAPSYLDEPWKLLNLNEATYRHDIQATVTGPESANAGASGTGRVYVPQSRKFTSWSQPAAYQLAPLHHAANPYQIMLKRPVSENQLWIHGKRPYSDTEALASESATTLASPRLLYAYAKEELARILKVRYPTDDRWNRLHEEALDEVDSETRSRTEISHAPRSDEHWGRI